MRPLQAQLADPEVAIIQRALDDMLQRVEALERRLEPGVSPVALEAAEHASLLRSAKVEIDRDRADAVLSADQLITAASACAAVKKLRFSEDERGIAVIDRIVGGLFALLVEHYRALN